MEQDLRGVAPGQVAEWVAAAAARKMPRWVSLPAVRVAVRGRARVEVRARVARAAPAAVVVDAAEAEDNEKRKGNGGTRCQEAMEQGLRVWGP